MSAPSGRRSLRVIAALALGGLAAGAPAARAANGPGCPAPAQRTEPLDVPAPAPGTCAFLPPSPPGWPAEWGVQPAPFAVGAEIEWEVPAGVSGMTVTLEALEAVRAVPLVPSRRGIVGNAAEPIRIEAPDGTVWFALDPGTEGPEDPIALRGPREGVGTLLVPTTTRSLEVVAGGGVPAGRWTMIVGDLAYGCATLPELDRFCGPGAGLDPPPDLDAYRAGRYRVSLVFRSGPIPDGGTVDLAFYLHRSFDERPLRAADAASDPDLQRLLASLQAYLARAGLCVGEVAWLDLPEWAQERWAAGASTTTECEGSFGELFSLARPGSRLDVFLVPGVTIEEEPAAGFTSAVPGPPALPATIHSGVAVTTVNLRASARCAAELAPSRCGPDATALVAAHEVGHYLGLYHPTEREGTLFDPLDDTPICDCRTCTPEAERPRCESRTAVMDPTLCHAGGACGGATNLMFWLQWNAEGAPPIGELSPEQSAVMRANPLVR